MEWWPVNPEPCASAAQSTGSHIQFAADSALEQQLPPLLQQHQQQQQQQQHQQHDQSAGEFDPWLACDDLELGTIIQQVSSGVMSSPSSDASMNQTALVVGSLKQEEPYGDSSNLSSIQPRRGAENKQHIINIINNSLPPGYQHTSGQQQQARNSSITASPLSSSLGSSPLNSLSSNYSSLSPHSPPSSSYQQLNAHQQHPNQAYTFANNDELHRQQQQQAQTFAGPNARLVVPTSGCNLVSSTLSTINSTQASVKFSSAGNRFHQSKSAAVSAQQQGAGLGASLLLMQPKSQSKPSGRQARRTTATKPISDALNLGAQAHKQRRCRHITDFVLADEERRLLIKEGHSDFPMDCQMRPLTKMEERILRKIRRKIRNKKSAQCSRQRKKEYVEELERKYAETVRENVELKQLLAKIHSPPEHDQEHQFKTMQVGADQMKAFGEQCVEPHTSCEPDPVEMHWKELFQSDSVADRFSAVHRQQVQQTGTSLAYD